MDLTSFVTAIKRLVRDEAGVLDEKDWGFYVQEAVKRYSRAKARKVVADVAGDGGYEYDLPAAFDPQFSRLLQVEYPAGRREPSYIDELDWMVYTSPSGTKLRLLADSPKATETMRVTFTAMHTVDESSTTVPAADHDALHLLGAALGCEALASHYSNATDSTIAADSVDHRSKAAEFAARAKRFMSMANDLVPVPDEDDVRPAGGETSLGDEMDLLTHPKR